MMGWLICPTSVWRLSKHRPTIKFMSHESQFCPILSVKLIMLAPSCHKKYLKHSFISSTHLESYSYNLLLYFSIALYGNFKILELGNLWLGLISNFYLHVLVCVLVNLNSIYSIFTYAYMETVISYLLSMSGTLMWKYGMCICLYFYFEFLFYLICMCYNNPHI